MEADVRTVEEIDIGRFRVAVGETVDDRFEAAVVNAEQEGLALAITSSLGLSRDTSFEEAPIVAAGEKYSAIGQAVDAFIEYASEDDSCTCGPDEACDVCGGNPETVEREVDE